MSNFVQYDGIRLGFVRTKAVSQEPVYLGPDRAGVRFTATWEVTLTRRAIDDGIRVLGAAPAAAGLAPNAVAALLAIQDRLLKPRRRLVLQIATTTPIDVDTVNDMELGPKPLKFVVLGFNAEGSALAEYTVQYTIPNPCGNTKLAYTSHVWKGEDDMDDQFFATRTYTGVIHWNPNVVGVQSAAKFHPDQMRALYLPPRTVDMHRVGVMVKNLEDGYTTAYRVQDRQPYEFCNSAHVVRMEAEHKVHHHVPGLRSTEYFQASAAYREAFAALIDFSGIVPGDATKRTDWLNKALGLLGSPSRTLALMDKQQAAYAAAIPRVKHTITATAYGHAASSYAELARACRSVCLLRLMQSATVKQTAPAPLFPGTGDLVEFGGEFMQHDRSNPRSVTTTLEINRRAPALYGAFPDPAKIVGFAANDPNADLIWAAGRPTIFRANAQRAGGAEEPIRGPNQENIPVTIRQLVYGGSILDRQPSLWGWGQAGFAPDLLSRLDANVRVDDKASPRGVSRVVSNPLQLMLLAAVQELCGIKAAFVPASQANRDKLP